MSKIYFVDGYGGSPPVNWLATEMRKLNDTFEVEQIFIGNPTVANVEDWDRDIEKGIVEAEQSYFVCHSLGYISLLRFLLRNRVVPKGCLFVSPFQQSVEDFPEFDAYFEEIDLQKLSDKLKDSIVISAENDEIIPWQYSQLVAKKLHIPFLLLPEGNHFRSSDGIIEFPEVSDFAFQYWNEE